jgi:hypothetical protein
MQKSWLERHPRWKIPLGLVILLFLMVVFGGAVMAIVTASFRSSEVYQGALSAARENELVRRQFGSPIVPAWLVSGQLNVRGSTGNADLSIPFSGPKGEGAIRAVAFKAGGAWHYTCLEVHVEGQDATINLLRVAAPVGETPDSD